MFEYAIDCSGIQVNPGDFVIINDPRKHKLSIRRVERITPKGVSVLKYLHKNSTDTVFRPDFLKLSQEQIDSFFKNNPDIAEFYSE
jgi:hypothetical protein